MFEFMSVLLIVFVMSACGHPEQGPRGYPGPTGSTGSQGIPGVTGATGSTGVPGVDATPTTVVKLCSACQPSYPSTFAEYAVCLQGQLYGVYSANGGFLALLPPGEYTSDGINCSCTFTVGDNCEVSQ